MLEAGKIINSVFNHSFIKRLCLYLHDCVREEVQSSTFRNLKQDKDNKWIFLETPKKEAGASMLDGEKLFTAYPEPLKLDGSDSYLTELMLQSNNSQKDKYLIYGYLFLVGKNSKSKRNNEFLTPLLYSTCTLERNGRNVECSVQEEGLSLNTAALTSLMNIQGEDDELDNLLDGLLEVVPKLPLQQEDLNVFLITLKSLIPDLELEVNAGDDLENNLNIEVSTVSEERKPNYENLSEEIEETTGSKIKNAPNVDKVVLTNKSAIILTKRPLVTAGVLYELMQIGEKPSGTIRETALNAINEEYLQGQGKMPSKVITDEPKTDFVPITPLLLSESQGNVIKNLEDSTILSVYGPPGTGKSQTIVNLVCHLVASGKTVLVASKMDKATDVIADRLNCFGAPFLALRAGRANYQKQLSLDLQDLVAGKVDIDNGFESSILVNSDDMKKLLSDIEEKEKACEELIQNEEYWHKFTKEYDVMLKILGQIDILNGKLSFAEIDTIDEIIKKLEKYMMNDNLFGGIFTSIANNKLRKIIKKKDFKANFENIQKIRLELEAARLSTQIRHVERKIQKYGNINNLLSEIKELKKKRSKLAIDILKGVRRTSLKGLLRDQVKRQRLIVHTKALVTKKQNLQNRLLEDEDFKPLMEAFPCWCVTSYAVSNSLPLKPGMFDVAIIDEASQCDIASCIPILYRCKKAVIVGDDKQLPHLSFLEKSKEQSFLSQYEIPDKYQLMWRFRENSMFDIANYYSMKPVLLDEHFRSPWPIIEFSNKEFYGGKMRIMSNCDDTKVLELIRVTDGKSDSDITRNMPEVEAIMQRLQELINEDEQHTERKHVPISIGILSPFRGQVELIKKALSQLYPEALLQKHKIEVGTAHTFQGDERDVMMLSLAIADNSFNQSLTFLQIPNLFNVAITRARKKQIVFLSKDEKSLPPGLLKNYIEYVDFYIKKQELIDSNNVDKSYYKNEFEREVANAFREAGFEVRAGRSIAGVSADLTIKKSNSNNILVLECDGVGDNLPSTKTQMQKQSLIERTGLRVERISYIEWYLSKRGCIDKIKYILDESEN
ncbi:AAA family ATPase [bacterium]|nr:AAA family ATPase [bacterium]